MFGIIKLVQILLVTLFENMRHNVSHIFTFTRLYKVEISRRRAEMDCF